MNGVGWRNAYWVAGPAGSRVLPLALKARGGCGRKRCSSGLQPGARQHASGRACTSKPVAPHPPVMVYSGGGHLRSAATFSPSSRSCSDRAHASAAA